MFLFTEERNSSNRPSSGTNSEVGVSQIILARLISRMRQGSPHARGRMIASLRQDRVTARGSLHPCGKEAYISAAEGPHPSSSTSISEPASPRPRGRSSASVRARAHIRAATKLESGRGKARTGYLYLCNGEPAIVLLKAHIHAAGNLHTLIGSQYWCVRKSNQSQREHQEVCCDGLHMARSPA